MQKKIVIAIPYPLLRIGLENTMKRVEILAKSHYFVLHSPETLGEVLLAEKPDLVLVSTSIVGGIMVQTLKEQTSCSHAHFVVVGGLPGESIEAKYYDASILFTDTEEEIEKKISRLFEQEEKEKKSNEEQQVLTPREKDIVICVVKGLTNKEIADELFLSTHTVITHRRNIAKKLQIHSPAGLTIYAIVNKLVELKDIKQNIDPNS